MLKFPYGLSDFYRIITKNYFYIDRTHHIQLIEDFGEQLLFLRPRRFGKSLLLSMLENYYDVAKAAEFEKLFGHLAIGQNPTPMHNQYFVMKWNFSLVKAQGAISVIEKALYDHINNAIFRFMTRYDNWLQHKIQIDPLDAISSFESLLTVVEQSGFPLYLLIDEYDNFANELIIGHHKENPSRYETLLFGEGIVKTLFKTVKSAAEGDGLERVFITGVAPVVLSDLSSGYYVAEKIYFELEFNDLCGFTALEIQQTLEILVAECALPTAKISEALTLMQTFYDGYCFNPFSTQFIYNPTLALYFFKIFQRHCQYPRQMLDDNLAMDSEKLSYIASLPGGESIIIQALQKKPPLTLPQLANRFGVKDMLKAIKDERFMISLLYYFGILTLNGQDQWGAQVFQIPNVVIRQLYLEKLKERFLPEFTHQSQSQQLAKQFYQTGDLQPLCDFMEQHYFKVFDNRDYRQTNELTIKTAFLTLLFENVFYLLDSETELEKRYADLTLILRPEHRHLPLLNFCIEFKYVSVTDAGLTGVKARQKTVAQIQALTSVQQKFAESKRQLIDYQKRFKQKYGQSIQLQLLSVVALGLERVVWEKVDNQARRLD
jgi:hypothetical protein